VGLSKKSLFTCINERLVESLGVRLGEYVHEPSGARHYHLDCDDTNNAFMVAFMTLPTDSTGVAHVLEHTALCGSSNYPVRDPFFMMLRRSLNTYMNAFTGSDTTAYPFATQNRKDFDNLLKVYLDAAFFPILHPLDFAQEGCRIEFENDDVKNPLTYQGVVYNEMKGAMSPPSSNLWQHVYATLFPDTPYRHNSGGEPSQIPNLSHEALKAFHAKHYCPANSVFMTYGSFSASEHQARFQELVLDRCVKGTKNTKNLEQPCFSSRSTLVTSYNVDRKDDRMTHLVWAWVVGDATDPDQLIEAHLISSILLEHSGSPLRHFLETTSLANSPSELCGIDDSARQLVFFCGVEGSEADNAGEIEEEIYRVVDKVASEGISTEEINGIIDRLELAQRDIGGGSYPFGLQLMSRVLPAAIHGASVWGLLNLEPTIDKLRKSVNQPDYIGGLFKKLLIDNRHASRISMLPEENKSAGESRVESSQLLSLREKLSALEENAVIKNAGALKQRQVAEDDPNILPQVTLADVPSEIKVVNPSSTRAFQNYKNCLVNEYAVASNGIFRAKIAYQIPFLTPLELSYFPLWCEYLTEFGSSSDGYTSTQARRAMVGDFSVYGMVRPDPSDSKIHHAWLILGAKGLARKRHELLNILARILPEVRFDEPSRLKDLLMQSKAELEQSITDKAHHMAILAAGASLSPMGALAELWDGATSVKFLQTLSKTKVAGAEAALIFQTFESIREKLVGTSFRTAFIGEGASLLDVDWDASLMRPDKARENLKLEKLDLSIMKTRDENAWVINSQVNFCAKVFQAGDDNQKDAPPLSVLARYIQDGFLHQHIREQGGAYGGGAAYDADSRSFRFYSYRDPRLTETFDDFTRSVEWFLNDRSESRLEESILGTVRALDQPSSPSGEAERAFSDELFGRSHEFKKDFRDSVLAVTHDSLREVCEKYLLSGDAGLGVFCKSGNEQVLTSQGMRVGELL
jgi:Zn-dependent M16 (insulinase) family peptidase